jgi:hypothetical protein
LSNITFSEVGPFVNQNRDLLKFENYIDVIDGFRDGLASDRVAAFVMDYLGARGRGVTRDDAIVEAVKIYRQHWGEDKVIL